MEKGERKRVVDMLPFALKEFLKKIKEVLILVFRYRFYWTPDIKINLINSYVKRFNLNIFVETGTYLGDTIFRQKDNFKKIYSIELSEYYYKLAKDRFSSFSNISLIFGNSKDKLEEILLENNEPLFFWLDGHYSCGLTAKAEDKDTPILEELTIIFDTNLKKHKHIILIDDARLFNGKNDYPKYKDLKKFIKEKDDRYTIFIKNDIIVCLIKF